MTTKEINDYIIKHWPKSYAELAVETGISSEAVRKRVYRLKEVGYLEGTFVADDAAFDITSEVAKRRERDENTSLKSKLNIALSRIETLQQEITFSKKINSEINNEITIRPKEGGGTSEATVVLVASDWHVEEVVNPATVNYLNDFNLDVADRRITQFFQNSLRLIKMFQNDVSINTMVLALLGDFITNTIHEELAESNSLLPVDAVIWVTNRLIAGIEMFLDNTDLSLIIPCHSGNHGRITKKQRVSTEAGNSLEYLMYHSLAQYFRNEERVTFILSGGYHTYVNIYDTTLRFHHGHAINFHGGVGGITIPVNKAIAQWNKAKPASIDIFGHFHHFMDGGNFIANGALIGFSPYALKIKADYEEPKQAMFLVDKKRKKTIVAPILFE